MKIPAFPISILLVVTVLLFWTLSNFSFNTLASETSKKHESKSQISTIIPLPIKNDILIGRANGTIELRSIQSGTLIWRTKGKPGSVIALWANESKKQIKAVSSWGIISEIDLKTGKIIIERHLHNLNIDKLLLQASISSNGNFLVIIKSRENQGNFALGKAIGLDITNLTEHNPRVILELHSSANLGFDKVVSAKFCNDSSRIIMTTQKGYALVWPDTVWQGNATSDQKYNPEPPHFLFESAEYVRRLGQELPWEYFPVLRDGTCDRNYIVTVGVRSDIGSIQLWSSNNMNLIAKHVPDGFDPHVLDPYQAFLDSDNHLLVTLDEIVFWLWNIHEGKLKPIGKLFRNQKDDSFSPYLKSKTVNFLDDKIIIGRGSDVFILKYPSLKEVGHFGDGPPLKIYKVN